MLSIATLPLPARADEDVSEYQVKAAFLYNFAKFVEWPPAAFNDPATPFSLCITGIEPYLAAKEILAGKTIRGRRIDVRHAAAMADAHLCHLLFVSNEDGGATPRTMVQAQGNALMVGEASDFIARGGVINLKRENDRIRFDIALMAGERSGFRFSAQILKLATIVTTVR